MLFPFGMGAMAGNQRRLSRGNGPCVNGSLPFQRSPYGIVAVQRFCKPPTRVRFLLRAPRFSLLKGRLSCLNVSGKWHGPAKR